MNTNTPHEGVVIISGPHISLHAPDGNGSSDFLEASRDSSRLKSTDKRAEHPGGMTRVVSVPAHPFVWMIDSSAAATSIRRHIPWALLI